MHEQDVVAELSHWTNQGVCPPLQLIRRARDEIVALRKEVTEWELIVRRAVAEHVADVRSEALEEAAREAASLGDKACAHAIRALKGER